MVPRLILVDDHELVRTGLARILDDTCDICGEASDGQEAIAKVLALHPDLVLLDLSMPVMGGPAAAREIRRLAPSTKIVFITMHDPATIMELAGDFGADACISKRARPAELYETIARVLDVPYDSDRGILTRFHPIEPY